jgi:hypothetical protein
MFAWLVQAILLSNGETAMEKLELDEVLKVAGGDLTCGPGTHVTVNASQGGNEAPTCDPSSGGIPGFPPRYIEP